MRSVRHGWKVAAAFALVVAIVGLSATPASAGWRRRKIIIENRTYYVPATAATTVYGAPVGAVVGTPVETVYTRSVIRTAPVPATVVAPPVVVDGVVPAAYVAPVPVRTKIVVPRRVYYAYPY